jgi:hypothetical protein
MTESQIVRQILDYLAAERIFAFRLNTSAFSGEHKGKRWFTRSHSLGAGAADILSLPVINVPDEMLEFIKSPQIIPTWIECREKLQAEKAYQSQPRQNDCTQGQLGVQQGASQDYLLREIFQYHSPSPFQQKSYETIREAAKHFAAVLIANTPQCADRTAALRKVREAVMTANAAIALDGLSF